jgi:hypothetical protein
VLLVSSLTPSGKVWALESAARTVGHDEVVDLDSLATECDDVLADITAALSVTGAQFTSVDLIGGMRSLREIAAIVHAWEVLAAREPRALVWVLGSVPHLIADLFALEALTDLAATSPAATTLRRRLAGVSDAVRSGDIEWLLGTPAQPDAIERAGLEVAAASGSKVSIRGVLVAPIPRKKDGWPRSIREAARSAYDQAVMDLHPVAVARSRAGTAPAFTQPAVEAAESSTIVDTGGDRVFTLTLPGLSASADEQSVADRVQVGTWSSDPAYPTTHVVVHFAGHTVRWGVDAILRRCRAIDAVVADDTIAVTFAPVPEQWPNTGEQFEGER